VKGEVERKGRRVVGVVLNVVDDQLPKGQQFVPRWKVTAIRFLGDLLQSALDAGRTVILTADHGHLVERQTELRRHEGGGTRYRPARPGGPAGDGEIVVRVPRVLLGEGSGLFLAWSERLHYTALQSGYHGGVSPQEVLVPLSVWAPSGGEIPGWKSAADEPDWWRNEGAQPTAAHPPGKTRAKTTGPPASQGVLFTDVAVARPAGCGGMKPLALARQLEVPLSRVHGLLAALQRILNVEGFPVLVFDPDSDKVTFDRPLFEKQFPPGEGKP